MKKKIIGAVSALLLAFFCYGESNAQVRIKGEIGAGLFSANVGVYATIGKHHMVGATALGGFVFPALAGQISPQYRYYISGHQSDPKGWSGSFFLNAGANYLVLNDLSARPSGDTQAKKGLENRYYFNVGGGYELRYKKFYIRPTVNAMLPPPGRGATEMLSAVYTASLLQTSIGFRF